MKTLLLAAIRMYRRYLSPYKGFSCAWRIATGGESCSAYGYRVISRHGTKVGIGLLRRRMAACGDAHRHATASGQPRRALPPALHRQRGDCDIGCFDVSSCDMPSCGKRNLLGFFVDLAGNACCQGACDLADPTNWRKRKEAPGPTPKPLPRARPWR